MTTTDRYVVKEYGGHYQVWDTWRLESKGTYVAKGAAQRQVDKYNKSTK